MGQVESAAEPAESTAASSLLAGGCACGATRYALCMPPLIVHACHCRDCQRLTGGAFVINALIEREHVAVQGGEPQAYALATPSGKGQTVYFCTTCGTALWSRYHVAPGEILFVRGGTLDRPDALKPDVHIYIRTKLPWLTLPDGARTFDAIYDAADVWPAETRARLQAHLARLAETGT